MGCRRSNLRKNMQKWELSSSLYAKWKVITDWLVAQDNPPKSYRLFPFNSEQELLDFKKDFQKATGISLGKYIRLKRVDYLLNQQEEKFQNQLNAYYIETPLGRMLAIFTQKGLCLLEFCDRKMLESELLALRKNLKTNFIFQSNQQAVQLENELNEYFFGKRKTFGIPLDLIGTAFQKSVWNLLLNIPYGHTKTYKEQAISLGNLNAIRAVAGANGRNQISILVPCHRVIGADGKLVGYGGGVERKRFLLDLENRHK